MPTLAEIRQQYPQYSDLDDGALAEGLYRKFYSDMPREEFDKKLGVAPAARPAEQPGALDTARDVAKSAGVGVVQGGIGLATLPGNIEQLGRMGINAVGTLAGREKPLVSEDAVLPTYNDAKTAVEGYTGEFYKPQTTAGEYARTAGEFASLAIGGPAGWANKAARVAAPAVVSETAGQMTEGTALEPWARIGGALAGGRVATAAAKSGQRAITPSPASPERQAAVKYLENEGVKDITAGQRTGSKAVQWAESTTQDVLASGGRAKGMMDNQAEQFTAAALKRAGVNANKATPDVIDTAFTNLGNQFDALAARNAITPTKTLWTNLGKIDSDYNSVVAPMNRVPAVKEAIDEIRNPFAVGRPIDGRMYQSVRARLEQQARALTYSDPNTAIALRKIRDALDDAMETSIKARNPGDLGAWKDVRGQYRNLLAIEDAVSGAGVAAAEGLITPSALRAAVKKQNKRAYVRGQGDLGPLARAGEMVMKPLPQSGTAPRANAMNMLSMMGGVAGYGAGGPLAAIGGVAAPAIGSRILMSPMVQNYLANQAAAGRVAIPEANAMRRVAPSIMYPVQEDEQTNAMRGF